LLISVETVFHPFDELSFSNRVITRYQGRNLSPGSDLRVWILTQFQNLKFVIPELKSL
jgi:hypothetical protein